MAREPQPVSADFDPPSLRDDFEDAYIRADVSDTPYGGTEAARRVEAILRREYPRLRIFVESGPHWIVKAEP